MIMKRREKNRFNGVASLIEYPSKIHSIINNPIYRITIAKLVITIAPQYDISSGRTYLRNAVTPLNHVLCRLNEW